MKNPTFVFDEKEKTLMFRRCPGASHIYSQHIYTAKQQLIYSTRILCLRTLSTSRLYQIELAHQVEILKHRVRASRIFMVLETKDFGFGDAFIRVRWGKFGWHPSSNTNSARRKTRENCMWNYKRSINLIPHIMACICECFLNTFICFAARETSYLRPPEQTMRNVLFSKGNVC